MKDHKKAMAIIEGILFISGDPVSIDDISRLLNMPAEKVIECVNMLKADYDKSSHGLTISKVGTRIRLTTKAEIFPYIEAMFRPKMQTQLSKAALETLAIIMFRQPVTRIEIDSIRGVNSEKALKTLLERNLICEVGRMDVPGRPILYGITEECMDYFGLENIADIKIKDSN